MVITVLALVLDYMGGMTMRSHNLFRRICRSGSLRRALSLMLLAALLAQCAPAVSAATIKKVSAPGELANPSSALVGPAAVAAEMKLTPSQAAARLPVLCLQSGTRLVLRHDSGTEFRYEHTSWTVHWRDKSALNLKFGWTTQQKNAASAVWQVSQMRFIPNQRHWKSPPGLVASGETQLPMGQGQSIFYVDLARFAPAPPSQKFTAISAMPAASRDAIVQATAQTAPRAKQLALQIKKPTALSSSAQTKLKVEPPVLPERTYYVRVVTLDSKANCIGMPSNPVEIRYGEFPPQSVTWYGIDPNNPDKSGWPKVVHPKVRVLKYVPIQKQATNATYRFEVIRDWPPGMASWKAGQKLDFTPRAQDKSWWEELGDFISDVVGFVADAADWVAKAYDSIKEFAVNLVASALGDWAKGPLMLGLNIGLAALGIPPTLPDWSELTSMGKDYLIQTAADYAGLPSEETAKAVNAVLDMAKQQENGGGNPAIWLKPDPEAHYRPAYLLLEVTNPSQQVTDRVGIRVSYEPVNDPDYQKYQEPVFTAGTAYMPHMNPGDRLVVPVYLTEYTQLRQLDTSIYAGLQRFWNRYHGMGAKIQVNTWFPDDKTQNQSVTHQTLSLERCHNAYSSPGAN